MPIYCSACGSPTPDLALYCQMCGKPLPQAKMANKEVGSQAPEVKHDPVLPLKAGSKQRKRIPRSKTGDVSAEEVLGVVRNVQRTSESVEVEGMGGVQVSEQVLTFRLELSNADGDITSFVPIEIRNRLVFGDVADGDRVSFVKGDSRLRRDERIYNSTTNSHVSAGYPLEPARPRVDSTEIEGVVRNLRRSVQTAPKIAYNKGAPTTSLQVLMFRVEVSDAQGQIQRYVQVDMRGVRIRGELAEGDRVRFPGGGKGLYRLYTVYNANTTSHITAEKFNPDRWGMQSVFSPAARRWSLR